jgi:hypothetical protein
MRSRRPPRASRPRRPGNYYRHDYYCPYYPYYYPYYWDYEYDYDYDYGYDDYYDWGNDYDWGDYEIYEPYSEVAARAYQKGLKQGMSRARAMLAKKAEASKDPEKGTE